MQIVTLVCALAVSLATLVIARAQTQPASPSSQPSNTQTITVRGCVSGRSIRTPPRPNDRDLMVTAPTYRLKGSKAMMDMLKEHDGHADEITGTTQIADATKAKAVRRRRSVAGACTSRLALTDSRAGSRAPRISPSTSSPSSTRNRPASELTLCRWPLEMPERLQQHGDSRGV